jgi:hypothetical protein
MTPPREPTGTGGNYLWQIRVPPWNSVIGLVLCALCGGGLIAVALHQNAGIPPFGTVALWGFGLAACSGAYAFGRWVLRPPLAIAASEVGLLTFLHVDKANYAPPGFLVPWADIASLSYYSYVSRGRIRRHALVVHLRPGHAPMPLEKISLQREPDALYWNVWSAATGKQVLGDLAPLLQRFGSSGQSAGR